MKSALLLLDLQNEMVDPNGKIGTQGLAAVVEAAGLLDHAARALQVARQAAPLGSSMCGSDSAPIIWIA